MFMILKTKNEGYNKRYDFRNVRNIKDMKKLYPSTNSRDMIKGYEKILF